LGVTGEIALVPGHPKSVVGHPVDRNTIPVKMNRTGTRLSEWVHVGEIAVILTVGVIAGRVGLPSRDSADISAATPISGI